MLNATGSYSYRAADDSIYAPIHDLADRAEQADDVRS